MVSTAKKIKRFNRGLTIYRVTGKEVRNVSRELLVKYGTMLTIKSRVHCLMPTRT